LRLGLIAMSAAGSILFPHGAKAAPATVPTSAETLAGFTSQGWPVVIDVARGRGLVRIAATGLNMTCTAGDRFQTEDTWVILNIQRNGRVHGTTQISPVPGTSVSITGGSDSLIGKFNRERSVFRGVWQLRLSFATQAGKTDSCQSGPVRVTAR
jgi:hypothetical protein